MRKPRSLLLCLLSIGWTAFTRGQAPPQTRVTIRGTGSNVSIERTDAPPQAMKPAEVESAPGVLEEAIRKKEKGVTDETLVRFLRAHASELPSLIDLESMTRLRSAGAGKSVIAYLASASAVEIGPTGAVGGASNASLSERETETEYEPEYGVSYGVPIDVGFGGFSRRSNHSNVHSFRRPTMTRPTARPWRPMGHTIPMSPRPDRLLFRR